MVELAVLPCHPERPPDRGKRLVGGPRREGGPEVGPHLPERGGRQAVPRVGGPFGVVVAGGQLRGPREAGGGSRPGVAAVVAAGVAFMVLVPVIGLLA